MFRKELRLSSSPERDETGPCQDSGDDGGGGGGGGCESVTSPLTSAVTSPSLMERGEDSFHDRLSSPADVTDSNGSPHSLRVEFVNMHHVTGGDDNGVPRCAGAAGTARFRGAYRGARYHQPRMSLLGKPLNYRAHKRDIRYRRAQAKIYNFLERPKDWCAISYHLIVWVYVQRSVGRWEVGDG